MPLMKSKSKKAFEKNFKAEMSEGKPKDQSLAIAYSVKRKAPKKMKDGGKVQHFDQGGETLGDMWEATKKGLGMDYNKSIDKNTSGGSTGGGNYAQPSPKWDPSLSAGENKVKYGHAEGGEIMKPKLQSKSSGRMVESSVVKSRRIDPMGMPMDENEDSKEMISKNSGNKPPKDDDWSSDVTIKQAQKPSPTKLSQPKLHGNDAFASRNKEMRDDENDLGDRIYPETDRAQPVKRDDELDADGSNPNPLDMEREHSNGRKPYARGGKVSLSMGQPSDEHEEEHYDSVAAAIMAKRDRMHDMIDSGAMDEDHAVRDMMAEGGSIKSHPSIYSDNSSQVDLSRNADEDANEEDQLSYNALRKENYSETPGLDQLDQPEDSNEHGDDIDSDDHDHIDEMRKRMKSRKQF